jgi:hypothetical protein
MAEENKATSPRMSEEVFNGILATGASRTPRESPKACRSPPGSRRMSWPTEKPGRMARALDVKRAWRRSPPQEGTDDECSQLRKS